MRGEAATYVALSADHLVAVELGGQGLERWLDESTTETEHQVQSRFLQNAFRQLSGPNQDSLPATITSTQICHCHTPGHLASSSYQIPGCSYLLDVVVGQGATVLELLSGEDQTLLVRGNALLVLDLRLDIVDGVGGLHLKGDRFPREGLDEAID